MGYLISTAPNKESWTSVYILLFSLFIFTVSKYPNPSVDDLDIDKVIPVDADLRTVTGMLAIVQGHLHSLTMYMYNKSVVENT
jgi:hypothetical protein